MENYESTLNAIRDIVDRITGLRNAAFQRYSYLVDAVVSDQIADAKRVEQIMDGLLDFCDEERFIEIYRKLCRHVYYHYPELVGEHVALFRALFETADDAANDGIHSAD